MKTVTSANNSHFSRSVARSMQHESDGSPILGAITLPCSCCLFWITTKTPASSSCCSRSTY